MVQVFLGPLVFAAKAKADRYRWQASLQGSVSFSPSWSHLAGGVRAGTGKVGETLTGRRGWSKRVVNAVLSTSPRGWQVGRGLAYSPPAWSCLFSCPCIRMGGLSASPGLLSNPLLPKGAGAFPPLFPVTLCPSFCPALCMVPWFITSLSNRWRQGPQQIRLGSAIIS